jgi:hypothetical protein
MQDSPQPKSFPGIDSNETLPPCLVVIEYSWTDQFTKGRRYGLNMPGR